MPLNPSNLYPFRIFTRSHTFMVLSPCATIDDLWVELEQNRVVGFTYPNKNGDIVTISVRSDSVEAIDTAYGTEPASQLEGPKQQERVDNRTRIQGGRIVIGQNARKQ